MRKCKLLSAFLAVLLVVSIMFSFSSCHGSYGLPEFSVPEQFNENEKINITFWAKNDTNNAQVNVYKTAIEDFEKLYPNIEVSLKLYTDYRRIYEDVITNISTGTTPNVCITYPDHIATYKTGLNVVVPLDELISDSKYGLGGSELKFDSPKQDEMVEQFMQEGVIDGEQYALPFMRSTEACYINKNMVEALGYEIPDVLTWEWIFEVSEAAMALGKDEDGNYKINGQKVLIPFIYKSTDNMMIQMLKQKEAGYSTDNGDVLLFNDTTTELLLDISEYTKNHAFSTFSISGYPGNYVNKGQCIFGIDSTAGATWMGTDAPNVDIPEESLVDFELVVKAIPQFDIENQKMISQGPSICIFNKKNTNEVLASWLFTQFLLTNKVQIGYAKTEGYVPVTKKAQNSPEYTDYLSRSGENNDEYYAPKIEASKILLNNLDNTFITPVFNGSANLRNAAGQLIEEVCKAVDRNKTVNKQFLEELYSKISTLYHLEEIGSSGVGRAKIDFDGIPTESKILISAISGVWLFLGLWYIVNFVKSRKKS